MAPYKPNIDPHEDEILLVYEDPYRTNNKISYHTVPYKVTSIRVVPTWYEDRSRTKTLHRKRTFIQRDGQPEERVQTPPRYYLPYEDKIMDEDDIRRTRRQRYSRKKNAKRIIMVQ
mmetsp:Transcript_25628/g.54005  ORF Transcript_25628/g.54005 Transcript_25628/m.54005 type:complete len:116 (+) Transcript_25628:162-509(+)